MAAVWLRLWADGRSRWRAWMALSVILGLAGGVVIASLAGARRTDSAYDRFLRWSNAADLVLFNAGVGIDFEKVRRLPEVAEALDARFAWMVNEKGVSNLDPVYAISGRGLTEVDRPKLLAGRRPDPTKVHEASISPVAARLNRLKVGSSVELVGLAPHQLEAAFSGGEQEPEGPRVTFRIVGIEANAGGFVHDASILLTPAFGRAYGDRVATIPLLAVNLKRGAADLASFKAGAERISGGTPVNFDATVESAREVNRTLHIQAVALRLFAALAGLAALVILGQALAREASSEAVDHAPLRALGMTRPQQWAAAVLRSGAIGLAGASVAGVIGVALSPLMAFGLAREVEPSPGLSFDAGLVVTSAAVVFLVTVVVGAAASWRATRHDDDNGLAPAGVRALPSRAVAALARTGMPPTAVTGVRMALEPGRGRSAVPTRSALVGTVLSLAAVVTALTFAASLHHLFTTPRLYGWNWDAVVGSPFDNDVSAKVVPALSENGSVSEFSSVSYAEVQVEKARVRALAFDTVQGDVLPPVVEGRAPHRPDEIVIGAKTLRDTGLAVGDRVEVRVGDEAASMRVVGRGVLPSMGESDEGGLGEGAFVTLAGLHRLLPEAPVNLFPVRFSGDVAARDGKALGDLEGFGLTSAEPPKGVADFGRVDNLPVYLSGLLVVLAAGTLAHTLVIGVRRRRRDLAILKTIGFVRRQVGAAVAWQATALVSIALVFGLPLGLAGGRWAWRIFAGQLGIVPEPVMPVAGVLLVVPATLVSANLLAALPGRAAAFTRPALVLRSE